MEFLPRSGELATDRGRFREYLAVATSHRGKPGLDIYRGDLLSILRKIIEWQQSEDPNIKFAEP